MAAIGHGRSYGLTTNVLGRSLPGIVRCRLWDDLARRPPLPTAALVTDIGNDIAYGTALEPLLRWLETCLQRLQDAAERLVITGLPLESVTDLPAWKFRLLSSLVFPGARIDRERALAKAEELDQHLLSFASRYGAYVVHPERAWYTWDPIHIGRAHRPIAWQKYLSPWSDGRRVTIARPSLRQSLVTLRARPMDWKFFGISRHRDQPTVRWPNGTILSLY